MIAKESSLFQPLPAAQLPPSGHTAWRSPSNIALVKYWGKIGLQLPANPSISFTLKNAYTETTLTYRKKEETEAFSIELYLEGERKSDFEKKILQFFERIEPYFSFLKTYHFRIDTSNSFPHSSGIASSASGMSALALCLCSIEKQAAEAEKYPLHHKASFIARLGSGSACRSLYGGLVVWGQHDAVPGSSDEWGVPYAGPADPVFSTFQDAILLVDKGEKKVSSSVGHGLMNSNPFSQQRFEVARKNLELLDSCLKSGNIDGFGKIVEQEALMLHALMMTSDPYFLLFKPNTVKIIEKVWERRNKNGNQLYITLDAGANVHLLYPEHEKEAVNEFIDRELIAYCENKQYICDTVGEGPEEVK